STHNSCIKCLWVKVKMRFACCWRAFFTHLENQHMLNPQNPSHLWLLHVLFLPAVNEDCLDFQHEWNCHPINGIDTNNKSPKNLHFLGQTQFGIYQDDCEGVNVDVIDKHYGVYGKPLMCKGNQSGAGHSADEEASSDEDNAFVAQVTELINQQQQHIDQDAMHVPSHRTLFTNSDNEAIFFVMLYDTIGQDIIPDGFGLMPAEWKLGHYPAFEIIRLGRQQSKQLDVSLTERIWYERACLWCQALIDSSTFCRGNGGTCECEEFHWPDDGKPVCHECNHGISKHSQASAVQQPNPLPLPAPPNLLSSQSVSDVTTASMPAMNSKVQTIFSNLTKQEFKAKYLLSTVTQTAAGARAEAIATLGLRKQKCPAVLANASVVSGSCK
ncbi:hypothetical protein J3R82DRAFT_4894, partial [Butyriboletus roseoflavus]